MINISIVIPTYNERENIKPLLKQWESVVEKRQEKLEIIVVDDDSPDGTANEVRTYIPIIQNLRLIQNKNRKGISAAWVTGCQQSRGEYIGLMDADLCHNPNDVMWLYDTCCSENIDMMIGSRYLVSRNGMTHKSLAANLASQIAQKLIRLFFHIELTDATHSLRVFKKNLVTQILPKVESNGNAWLMEFSLLAEKNKCKISERSITYGERIFGETKLSLGKEGLRSIWRLVILRIKL